MADKERFDAIIVGSGQAGMPLASAFANHGWKTALVERSYIGGTCINYGCTPTKSMLASARTAHLVRQAGRYGVQADGGSVDLALVRKRKQEIVESFRNPNRDRIEQAENIELIRGEAAFANPGELTVDLRAGGQRAISSETIVINTGGRPARPPITGLGSVHALTSTTIMELDDVPARLLIVGGGYVAVEFGQMFARFGSQVTIIERSGQLLAREDTDIASEIADLLRDEGITILTNAEATELAEGEDGGIIATIRADDGDQTLTGSHLLLAVGRVPNTDALRPAAGGVELNKRGYIQVDDKLRTTATGVYAVGDVKGGPAFTHISYDDYRVLAANLLHGKDRSIGDRLLAYTIFTDPQLGRVGMSERQATQAGRKVRVAKMPMSYVARAIEVGETRGLMKAIVDADSDQILGAAVFGIQGGELVSAIQVAMLGKVPYTVLRDAPFAHPTLAESLNNLFGALA